MLTFAAGGPLSPEKITVLLLSVGVLLGAARMLGELARKLGQPAVLGEILAGVLLGATVLEPLAPGFYEFLFPKETADGGYSPVFIGLETLVMLSAVFLLLVAGLEVDLSAVLRQGKAAVSVSLAGMLIPFGLGMAFFYPFASQLGLAPGGDPLPFALFVGIAMSITALPVIAKILLDLHMFRSDLGMLIMSSAMVNDLIGWIGFALVLAMISPEAGSGGATGVLITVGLTLAFVGGMLTLGKWAAHRSMPWVQANLSWPGGPLGLVLVAALLCAAATEAIGIHSIFGAFIVGIAIGDSPRLRAQTRETIEQFISNIFAPLFFASIGLRVNFIDAFDLKLVVVVFAIAMAGKVFGCWAGAKLAGLSSRDSWATGFGMSARGAMEIILAQLALNHGLITEQLFVAIVIMALGTSLLAGPAMQRLLGRKQRKTLGTVISEKQFVARLDASEPWEAIRQLCGRAAELTGLDPDRLTGAVWAREQLQSTGLGHGVAVPHARVAGLDKPVVVIGLDHGGLDFNAPDGEQAHLICLLLTPEGEASAQIELLRMVGQAFQDEQVRREAMEARTYTEFRAALTLGDAAGGGH